MINIASGCFAAITANHVRYLEAAATRPGRLIVAVASAEVIRALKGERDVIDDAMRIRMIGALPFVYAAVLQRDETPIRIFASWRPSRWIKGGDYSIERLSATDEGQWILATGGSIEITARFDGVSTTDLIGGMRDGETTGGQVR